MLKKITRGITITFSLLFALAAKSQNPGLVISEVMANPNGTDSCMEYVELRVTKNINFATTPYSVIVSNNGTATQKGWKQGGAITYGFEINTGTVSQGDVVYVGGSCMNISGTKIRVKNVKYTAGDGGLGNLNAGGVFGNGGTNADGVGVFSLPIASIDSASVPVDAILFGTGIGNALVAGGAQGYQLPVNDTYSGGKLQSTSYFAGDPGADVLVTATGAYNTVTNSWTTPRAWTTGTVVTDGSSSVALTTTVSPASIGFLSNDTTVVENAGTASIYLKLANASPAMSSVDVTVTAWSNASASDYTLAATTITFAPNATANSTQPITFQINDDAINESTEYLVLKLANPVNATIAGITQHAFYIADNDLLAPTPSNALQMNLLSSFSNTVSGSNSAEIVVHDPSTQRLYIANSVGAKLDIVDFLNPSAPVLLNSIPVTPYGNINSVAVRNGTVALAIENGTNPQDSGKVVFLDKDGVLLKQVTVGMMPDMITFNHAGTKVYTANEGEPNTTYTADPDGSIGVVDLSAGVANATASHITFTSFNGQEATLRAQGIRIFGPSATTSKDLEPEYITISDDDTKAWVTLQENNAIAELNLTTKTVTAIRSLGSKNHNLLHNGFDASNNTKGINISNFPIKGLYMPDAITKYTVGGVDYLITANEGDSREYTAFTEVKRIAQATLDPVKFPNAAELQNNYVLGRLNITDKLGDIDNDGDLDTLYSYGARSFSIWNASTGVQVYDSGDDFEKITAANTFSVMFNASNSSSLVRKDRSDDKGPEPEGVTTGVVNGITYAFIALERIGGVMVYDITNPNAPVFVTYVNNRNAATNGPDRGAEGIIFIPQSASPNGQHLVIAANEVSSTLSIWGIPGCASPLSTSLTVTTPTAVCQGDSAIIAAATGTGLTYTWTRNGATINGATSHTVAAKTAGNYAVTINGGTGCTATSLSQSITINPLPVQPAVTLVGDTVTTANVNGVTYQWYFNAGAINNANQRKYKTNGVNGSYSVKITDANGCSNTSAPFTLNTTGIQSVASDLSLQAYPNPFANEINLSVNATANTTLTAELYNSMGQRMDATSRFDVKQGENRIRMDVGHLQLPQGFYFLKVSIGGQSSLIRLVK